MTVPADLVQQVQKRAVGRCEYCRMHGSLQGATFHVEHTCPTTAGGHTVLDNLAWACPSCNLHKSSRQRLSDPLSQEVVPLFNPRRDEWPDHFHFVGFQIVGLTAVGRALIAAFDLNSERRLRIREAEAVFQLFPPS